MIGKNRFWITLPLAVIAAFAFAESTRAQGHQIEGRVQFERGRVSDIKLRLLLRDGMLPIAETFSWREGQFAFKQLLPGDYIIETAENKEFEPSTTYITVYPQPGNKPSTTYVMIDLSRKAAPEKPVTGLVAADIDHDVPREAVKHYIAGVKALESGDSKRGIKELKAAIKIHPDYYSARLELGRELRMQKEYKEAESTLKNLGRIAPNRADPRAEYGATLLALNRVKEGLSELRAAISIEETNWTAHLYLGWGLLESDANASEKHLKRAIELNERKAVRAHLALARIANEKGMQKLAVEHLDAYLALAPNAPDAEAVKRLADQLR